MAIQTQRYAYFGPLSGASLRVGEQTLDVVLHPGKPVELPANHAFTKTLLAQKRLVAVTLPPPAGKGVKS